ncbi:ABC transporter ATP-binding protein [Pseudoalteromonas sp. T1lg65]|uniref:ABC transporter ATP-binding protein n=1 Tax=Pseudoalteromonas sp. T1lg65 TaxID=2077101 RepID=UPI003F7AF941
MENTIINVSDASKHYTSVCAVNKLSFAIPEGEIFALLGPNGAGKSSLVRMLVGFTQPDHGQIQVTIDGETFDSIPNTKLGYLPEDRGLYPEKSVLDNLLYFSALRGVDKKTAIKGIDHWLARLDLSETKTAKLKSLSKGNQQKVQLISAVLHKPKVVLLDEPFSGLDPVNQEKVVSFLAELKQQGMTVILSAHQMAMVEKLADRMLLMNKGQAIFYGSLDDIRQQAGGGITLNIEFTQPLTEEAVAKHSHINMTLNKQKTKVSCQLSDSADLAPTLNALMAMGEFKDIDSRSLDLHQLYLQAVEEAGQQDMETTYE